VVGNISSGGTGKTPMISYLIDNLSKTYHIGVLSRGYGRKTKGFRKVEIQDSPKVMCDEPLLLKKLYPENTIVVCKNRILAVIELLTMNPEVNQFLMDDGFKHLAILPKLNIVLTTFYKLFGKTYNANG
jgi:tetraacyldisaccharide 4'-kinase